jgi:hypothetical protein
LKDQAINAYKRAADLYEEQGNVSQYQKIKEKIYELENPPETIPPTLFSDLRFILLLLALTGILGTLIVYYFIKKRT